MNSIQRRIHLSNCLAAVLAVAAATGPATNRACAQAPSGSPKWDTFSDTWVGVDGLGRVLPTFEQVGPPRANKTLGMFYFQTFDHGMEGPYDNTKILAAHPEAMTDIHNPAWGPLNRSHYWGEPLFGYYASDDEWALRKHAQMLSAAGVDVVIFDNSNAVTYDRARMKLLRVWEQIRREGGKTPQVAFLCPFGNPGHIGSNTLRELYNTLYGPGLYADLWFRWEGKPLVLADASYADATGSTEPPRQPTELPQGTTLGQTFTAEKPFLGVGGEFPTWSTADSGMTLSLFEKGPGGHLLARRRFEHVADNATVMLDADAALPAGKYYLEMSRPVGKIGWWGYSGDVYAAGQAFDTGEPAGGDRALHVRYAAGTTGETIVPSPRQITPEVDAAHTQTLRDFFTFRTPIAPYNILNPPKGQWAWLQIYPQAPQTDAAGTVEQITVGVAQNYNATVNNTAPMSVPGAFGRSYHDGHLDTSPDAVRQGFNFAEQWKRALQVDPPFVFVTGWNEWTAGFYESWVRWHAPPPIFVDQFNQEFSRDIEPMRGGHGDDYYYQLVANSRRYRGVRPLPPVTAASINLNGGFSQWRAIQPEFRDDIGDTAPRDARGVTNELRYRNRTGRNDIVAAKVAYDARNVYFYVRTHAPMTAATGRNWMQLFLNTDGSYKTGWLGYDFVVNRLSPSGGKAYVERHAGGGGKYAWSAPVAVPFRQSGNEMMLTIPRALLRVSRSPAAIDFKWADNCIDKGDWTDFTLNGDAAPNDRFNYRAKLAR